MISKLWRDRLFYGVVSVFVGWHTIAILLAPAPEKNQIIQTFRRIYQPYLTFFGLDTTWDFFSPVGTGHQLRYIIEDASGNEHTFIPVDEARYYLPERRWFERTFQEFMTNPEPYAEYFAARFCQKHAALKPVTISFVHIEEAEFWPEDYLAGKRPRRDAEYYESHILKTLPCPQQPSPSSP